MSTSKRAALLGLGVAFVAACNDDATAPKDVVAGIGSADELVEVFESFYAGRDYDGFVSLLADDASNAAEFLYIPPVRTIERSWGRAQEAQIHRRMFTPENVAPGEPAVPAELHLAAINASLTRVYGWQEYTELYRSEANPTGLPPEKWRAVWARFTTFVFFDTRTDNDFLVEGEAVFTVIEDLEKSGTTPGRFLLLQWADIDTGELAAQEKNWTGVKNLYRAPEVPASP